MSMPQGGVLFSEEDKRIGFIKNYYPNAHLFEVVVWPEGIIPCNLNTLLANVANHMGVIGDLSEIPVAVASTLQIKNPNLPPEDLIFLYAYINNVPIPYSMPVYKTLLGESSIASSSPYTFITPKERVSFIHTFYNRLVEDESLLVEWFTGLVYGIVVYRCKYATSMFSPRTGLSSTGVEEGGVFETIFPLQIGDARFNIRFPGQLPITHGTQVIVRGWLEGLNFNLSSLVIPDTWQQWTFIKEVSQ